MFNMVSKPLQNHWVTCYQGSAIWPPTIDIRQPSLIVMVISGCVKESFIVISSFHYLNTRHLYP